MADLIRPGDLDEDRLERSRRIDWLDMEKVLDCNCLVVGAGALGNEVVKDLVLSGCQSITVVDMDRVVRSNLNRCVFFGEEDADARRFKSEVVALGARKLDPKASIVPLIHRIEELDESEFDRFDLAFGCLDNVAARLHLNSHAYLHRLPYIDGGTMGTSGKVQVILPPETPCLQCSMNRTHYHVLEKRFSCTGRETSFVEPKLPAEITTTSIIAAIQVREGLKILSGRKEDCLRNVLYYNGLRNASEVFEAPIDPQCPMHI